MTFGRAWVLLLAWLPLAWMYLEWRRTARHAALALKAIAFAAILVALAEPSIEVAETKMAVAVLVDTSASMPGSDLARESRLAAAIEAERGRHWAEIIPFARSTRSLDPSEGPNPWKLRLTAGEGGRGTDLEAAVRDAEAALPAGLIPRVVLISDGKENMGSVARAAWQAQQLNIPIDTIALAGRPQPKLRLESVTLPSIAFSGERFAVDMEVSSPSAAEGQVEIEAEGKSLGKDPVSLESGVNRLRVHANLNTAGALDLAISVRAGDLGEVRFNHAVTLRRPHVLYISQDPPGTEANLTEALTAAQFDVRRAAEIPGGNLSDYQLVVLNNWDLEGIPAGRKEDLENFVKQGGGLLVIGGEKNQYVEGKKAEDALDRALPAKLAPPRSPEGTCVVLVIDKSSSMEGRKMDLARLAAVGVVDNLRPIDLVGVLIFDNSFQWAVPLRRAEDRTLIKRLISGITPDGGTQIAPALSEAYRRVLAANATYKHIVLLTDGISEEGDSLDLAREAIGQRVTISTVGLGQDVNRAYLEKIASLAGGKSYFLNDPRGLEKILLHDVMEHTGSTAVEQALRPTVARQAEILDGVGMESAPPLRGYVRFIAKPGADVILSVGRKDPLFTRWQYGLGRSAVFASDAKSRWATDWVSWKGYDKFWANVFRDLLPHAEAGEANVEFDSANSELVVDYRLSRSVEEPGSAPPIFVLGPDGFQREVPIKKIAAGVFRGRVLIGQRQGLFRVRPLAESRAFPEAGYYRPEQELNDYGPNVPLLRQVAEFTGGRFNPPAKEIFRPTGRSIPSKLRLWPGLLALAVALNLAELVERKWKGLFARIAGRGARG